jgi:hypothetical protein
MTCTWARSSLCRAHEHVRCSGAGAASGGVGADAMLHILLASTWPRASQCVAAERAIEVGKRGEKGVVGLRLVAARVAGSSENACGAGGGDWSKRWLSVTR